MSEDCLRVIDTGVRGGRANMAFDQALVDAHRAGEIPDSLRLLQFAPCVLLGRHQCVSREVDLAWCARHGVEIGRRITGGGALYLDADQLGWEVVCARRRLPATTLAECARLLCTAVATGLGRLGVAACYRPRNDIEVAGRKLGGTGGFFDGDTLFYQGTLLLDVDAERMSAALRLPADKGRRHGLDAAGARVIGMRELMGGEVPLAAVKAALVAALCEALGCAPVAGAPSAAEAARAAACLAEEVGQDEFVHGLDCPSDGGYAEASRSFPGGTITVYARRTLRRPHALERVFVTGDFFVSPPRIVLDLEAALRDTPLPALEERVATFFAQHRPEVLSITPADISATLRAALAAAD